MMRKGCKARSSWGDTASGCIVSGIILLLTLAFAGGVVLAVGGCTIHLHGGGELSAGMRNDNFFVFKHTVDGDKMGKESKATLEADSLLEAIAGKDDTGE